MIKEQIKGFGEFEFFDGYFIGRINGGVNAGSDFVDALSELIRKQYHGKPIIYISDRVNSYSIDPFATMDLSERNNIRFAAVVTYTHQQKKIFPLEVKVMDRLSMCNFDSLDAALNWATLKVREIK